MSKELTEKAREYATTQRGTFKKWNQFDKEKYKAFLDGADFTTQVLEEKDKEIRKLRKQETSDIVKIQSLERKMYESDAEIKDLKAEVERLKTFESYYNKGKSHVNVAHELQQANEKMEKMQVNLTEAIESSNEFCEDAEQANERNKAIVKYAKHEPYPECQINKRGKCTCGLEQLLSKTKEG